MGLGRSQIVTTGVRPGVVVVMDHVLNLVFCFCQVFKILVHFKVLFEDTIDSLGKGIF